MAQLYNMDVLGFKWGTYAKSPEEAEAHFRSNLAVLMRKSPSRSLRSKAARVLRRKP